MPPYRYWLDPPGPIVDVRLTNGQHTATFEAIIDTGADMTYVPGLEAQRANLQKIGEEPTEGIIPGDERTYPLYRATNLSFEGITLDNHPVVGYEQNYGLIGRDILNQLLAQLDGPAQDFTLQQPPV